MRPAGVGPEGTDPADTEPVVNPDQAGADPVARCEQGLLRGRHRRGVQLFAGICYAAPPIGLLRFRSPEPPEQWDGERDACRFGPAAPQLPGEGLTSTFLIPAVAPADAVFHLQSSLDMEHWTTQATRIANGPWIGTGQVESVQPGSGFGVVLLHIPDVTPELFTRLLVELSP